MRRLLPSLKRVGPVVLGRARDGSGYRKSARARVNPRRRATRADARAPEPQVGDSAAARAESTRRLSARERQELPGA